MGLPLGSPNSSLLAADGVIVHILLHRKPFPNVPFLFRYPLAMQGL